MTARRLTAEADALADERAAFASFGPEIDERDVPALVEAGHSVWSFTYGDELGAFTTLDDDDLWAFGGSDELDSTGWAPFRHGPGSCDRCADPLP